MASGAGPLAAAPAAQETVRVQICLELPQSHGFLQPAVNPETGIPVFPWQHFGWSAPTPLRTSSRTGAEPRFRVCQMVDIPIDKRKKNYLKIAALQWLVSTLGVDPKEVIFTVKAQPRTAEEAAALAAHLASEQEEFSALANAFSSMMGAAAPAAAAPAAAAAAAHVQELAAAQHDADQELAAMLGASMAGLGAAYQQPSAAPGGAAPAGFVMPAPSFQAPGGAGGAAAPGGFSFAPASFNPFGSPGGAGGTSSGGRRRRAHRKSKRSHRKSKRAHRKSKRSHRK